ncbi:MAG: hypothetical protein R3Y12_05735 [Clostridia bacterium]
MSQNKEKSPMPSPKDAMKNRLPIAEMKEPIEKFLSSQNELYIANNNNSDFPDLEVVDYRYVSGEFIIILTPASIFQNIFKEKCSFTGFIFEKESRGLKTSKRVYGKFEGTQIDSTADILQTIAETDQMVKKMLSHGAKFYKITPKTMTVYFSQGEIFSMDENMNPSFAPLTPSGKERFEHSRKILMEYEGREVIFNSFIENNMYYTLTKADSNKVNYIKNGGVCQFFDGRDNHFSSKVTILPQEKAEEIFTKLKQTNNSFFKQNEGLLALSFSK